MPDSNLLEYRCPKCGSKLVRKGGAWNCSSKDSLLGEPCDYSIKDDRIRVLITNLKRARRKGRLYKR